MESTLLETTRLMPQEQAAFLLQLAEGVVNSGTTAQGIMDGAREMRMTSGGDEVKFALSLEAGDLADTLRDLVRCGYKLRNILLLQYPYVAGRTDALLDIDGG